jgi:demethylmenaquinone methyltransferase/2-methoxy-6-polyprenyl-1,4-benzoquinol methylase
MSAVELEEARAAAMGQAQKGAYVRGMFSAIAPRYDLLNRVLSLSLDRAWRRRAIAALDVTRRPKGNYLDLCAGTLDVAASIAQLPGFAGNVIGADFAEPMLQKGRAKAAGRKLAPVVADALSLPLASASCAGAIVAFGIRNVANLDVALAEVFRVLEPGARFVILEFTTPHNPVVRAGYHAYFHHVLPRIGALVSGHSTAYTYLPVSVAHFASEAALGAKLKAAGFSDVRWETMMLGIVAIHGGAKPE